MELFNLYEDIKELKELQEKKERYEGYIINNMKEIEKYKLQISETTARIELIDYRLKAAKEALAKV